MTARFVHFCAFCSSTDQTFETLSIFLLQRGSCQSKVNSWWTLKYSCRACIFDTMRIRNSTECFPSPRQDPVTHYCWSVRGRSFFVSCLFISPWITSHIYGHMLYSQDLCCLVGIEKMICLVCFQMVCQIFSLFISNIHYLGYIWASLDFSIFSGCKCKMYGKLFMFLILYCIFSSKIPAAVVARNLP